MLRDIELRIREELTENLPDLVVDVHSHIGLSNHHRVLSEERKKTAMSASECYELSAADLKKKTAILIPNRDLRFWSFPFPFKETYVSEANNYVLAQPEPIVFGPPTFDSNIVEHLYNPNVVGLKTYYDLLDKPYYDISIREFSPKEYLEALNDLGKVWILHVPRNSLADTQNLNEVHELAKEYPNINIMLAHMGRCHTGDDFRQVIPLIKEHKNLYFDTSTCTERDVYREAFSKLPLNRIIHGTDAPYAFTRGKIFDIPGPMGKAFITEEVFDWTLPHLREWYEENNPFLTFLLYHQMEAVSQGISDTMLAQEAFDKVYRDNALELLAKQI